MTIMDYFPFVSYIRYANKVDNKEEDPNAIKFLGHFSYALIPALYIMGLLAFGDPNFLNWLEESIEDRNGKLEEVLEEPMLETPNFETPQQGNVIYNVET